MPRQKTYELVQVCAIQSWEQKKNFADFIRQNADIASRLNPADLDEIFYLGYYLRH